MSELCICHANLLECYRRRRATNPIAPRPSRANEDGSGTAVPAVIMKLKSLAPLGPFNAVPVNVSRPPPPPWPSKWPRFPPFVNKMTPRSSLVLTVNAGTSNVRKSPRQQHGRTLKAEIAKRTLVPGLAPTQKRFFQEFSGWELIRLRANKTGTVTKAQPEAFVVETSYQGGCYDVFGCTRFTRAIIERC